MNYSIGRLEMLSTIALQVAIVGVSWFVGLLMGVRIQSKSDCAEIDKLIDKIKTYRSYK